MARYEHLPLFKTVYDFNLYFFKLSRGFAKDYKHGLAVEIRLLCTELLDDVIIANNQTDKRVPLQNMLIVIERIKIHCRMLKDLDVMSMRSYTFSFRSLAEISRQVNAWKIWTEKGRD